MSDIKTAYGSNGQAITITLASLGAGTARQSDVIDNTTNKFLDALVQIKIASPGSGTSATGYVAFFVYATNDDGTTYSGGATGSDASITLAQIPALRHLGSLSVIANSTNYISSPMSVAAAFGGVLPAKWGLVVFNDCGGTLNSTEGNHLKKYQGIYQTVA